MTEATSTTATMTATGGRKIMHDLPERRKNARAAEEYRAGGRSTEESEDKSAKWSGEDTEESALEEENMITGGAGEAGRPLTLMTGESAVNNARDGGDRGGGK